MKLFRLLALGALIAGLPSTLLRAADAASAAADKKAAAEAKAAGSEAKKAPDEAKKKRDWYPFYGVVDSVDTKASTISLHKKEGVRVLHMDGKSTISHYGKSATLSDVKPGDYAHGKLHKNTRDEEVITDGKFDKEAPKKDGKKAKKAKAEKAADDTKAK